MTPDQIFPELPILKLQFSICTDKPLNGHYTGSAWRGILGWEMQKLICPLDKPVQDCIIKDSCPYFILFEKNTSLPGLLDSPRGYVLYSSQPADKEINLQATLIGHCTQLAPLIVQSLSKAQKRGLGKNANPFKLKKIQEIIPQQDNGNFESQAIDFFASDPEPGEDLTNFLQGPFPLKQWLASPDLSEDLQYSFEIKTPLRLRKKGKYLQDLDLEFLMQSILRRLEALNCIFAQGESLGREQWKKLSQRLTNMVSSLECKKDFSWWDYQRYSNRQKRKVPMGGFTGSFTIENPSSEVINWLRAAELIHVGKGAALGLGAISMKELVSGF